MNQGYPAVDVLGVMPLAVATGLFISLCTIQAPDGLLGASGAPSGTYANVTGLVGIRCMDAPQPPSEIKLGALERRMSSEVTAMAVRHVLLDNYYPTIIAGWRQDWRAVVDSTIYDIAGVECDSQRQMIRLELHLVTAGAVQA